MITSDEQYNARLARIVKASEFIANPLTDEADRIRYLDAYDKLCVEVNQYKAAEGIKADPIKREHYETLGWMPKHESTPQPTPEPELKKQVDLSSWLDND